MIGALSKRDMLRLGGAGFAAGMLPHVTYAQATAMSPIEAADFHKRQIVAIRRETVDRDPFSAASLENTIERFRKADLVPSEDISFVMLLLEALLNAETREAALKTLRELLAGANDRLNEITRYIAHIAISSVEIAVEVLRDIDWPRVRRAALEDLSAALDGASFGSAIGGRAGAIICAIAAAAHSSGNAYAAIA